MRKNEQSGTTFWQEIKDTAPWKTPEGRSALWFMLFMFLGMLTGSILFRACLDPDLKAKQVEHIVHPDRGPEAENKCQFEPEPSSSVYLPCRPNVAPISSCDLVQPRFALPGHLGDPDGVRIRDKQGPSDSLLYEEVGAPAAYGVRVVGAQSCVLDELFQLRSGVPALAPALASFQDQSIQLGIPPFEFSLAHRSTVSWRAI
jgi:hypothetical protein